MFALLLSKKSYLGNDKYIEANTQALEALRHTHSKDYLFIISHCDFAFVVWNTLTSPKLHTTNYVEKELLVNESDETCYMVQGIDSLEVHSDTNLDDSANSSNDLSLIHI